jgi:hypothetical protein
MLEARNRPKQVCSFVPLVYLRNGASSFLRKLTERRRRGWTTFNARIIPRLPDRRLGLRRELIRSLCPKRPSPFSTRWSRSESARSFPFPGGHPACTGISTECPNFPQSPWQNHAKSWLVKPVLGSRSLTHLAHLFAAFCSSAVRRRMR